MIREHAPACSHSALTSRERWWRANAAHARICVTHIKWPRGSHLSSLTGLTRCTARAQTHVAHDAEESQARRTAHVTRSRNGAHAASKWEYYIAYALQWAGGLYCVRRMNALPTPQNAAAAADCRNWNNQNHIIYETCNVMLVRWASFCSSL